jgi:polyisoprenoid-binding protein YceI
MPLLNSANASRRTLFLLVRILAYTSIVLTLSACQTPPVSGSLAPVATAAPVNATNPAAGGKRFVIDSQASEIRLLVYRDGPMARFGHNHVLQGSVRGEIRVADASAASTFQLEIPLEALQVDPPAARAEEGADFSASVSDPARQGTRENLLGPDVLAAAAHPLIRIESLSLQGPRWSPLVNARITVRGVSSPVQLSAAVLEQRDSLTVIATFPLRQSELGMKPFSVMGGAISVLDRIDVRVRLVARLATD